MTAPATFTKVQIKAAVKAYNAGTALVVVAADLHTAVEKARAVLVAGGANIRKPGRPRKVVAS